MYINTTALVLRETAYKDSSKILTVLTRSDGKLTVSARGALRRNSKLAAPTQLFVFSEMTLFSNRDRWTLTEARCIEQFIGLRNDVELLSLASYFAELIEAAADEDCPGQELLPLCLNALYALSEGLKPPEYVKPAFELRLMSASGFAPLIDHCSECETEVFESASLSLEGGTLFCEKCAKPGYKKLSRGTLSAMKYILQSDTKKLFSFKISETALRELYRVAELYLLTQFDRKFRTLEYYTAWTFTGNQ